MLLGLSKYNIQHPGRGHVVELLDHFYHAGPNGNHLCLVLPAMVSDGQAMVTTGTPHQAGYIQLLSRQILLGLDFLYQSGIVHCGKLTVPSPVSRLLTLLRLTASEYTSLCYRWYI